MTIRNHVTQVVQVGWALPLEMFAQEGHQIKAVAHSRTVWVWCGQNFIYSGMEVMSSILQPHCQTHSLSSSFIVAET